MGTNAPKLPLTGSQTWLVKNLNPKVEMASQLPLSKVARIAASIRMIERAARKVTARKAASIRLWLLICLRKKLLVMSADFEAVDPSSKSAKNGSVSFESLE